MFFVLNPQSLLSNFGDSFRKATLIILFQELVKKSQGLVKISRRLVEKSQGFFKIILDIFWRGKKSQYFQRL